MTALTQPQRERLAQVETLHGGAGSNGLEDACLMQAVDWVYRNKDHFTDSPECACPILTAFGIRLNDARWPTDKDRTDALRPAIPPLIGTRTKDEGVLLRRRYRLVDFAAREAAPYWFDYAYGKTKKALYKEYAAKMRGAAPVTDAVTMEAARVLAAYATAYANAAYTAYANAAYAANAAANAAASAAASSAPTTDGVTLFAAAAAADAAAYADAARLPILQRAAEVLIEACSIR